VVAPAVAAAELGAWAPADEGQRALKYALLAFLDARPDDACDRSCVAGHLTASALLLDAAGEHTLLTLHPRVGRWLHVDVHPVTCSLGVPTRHLDVRYLVHAPAGVVERISDESDDLRWWPVDALPEDSDTVGTMVAAARARAAPSSTVQ